LLIQVAFCPYINPSYPSNYIISKENPVIAEFSLNSPTD
jgi:hypothetical protein